MMLDKFISVAKFILISSATFLMLNYVFEGEFKISLFEYGAITGVVVWEIRGWFMENK